MNILLADDSLVNQRVVCGVLQKRGHLITLANNGLEAVEAVRAQVFDIVLMDMHMPEMDGLTATRCIRALESPSSGTMIIALTAAAFPEDSEACLAAGMDEVLHKPISHDRPDCRCRTAGLGEKQCRTADQGAYRFAGGPTEANIEYEHLNHQFFDMRSMLGEEEMGNVIQLYMNSIDEMVPIMMDATKSLHDRGEAAHALKGASDMIGLNEMRALCLKVMVALREESVGEIDDVLASLPDRAAAACDLLKSTLAKAN